MKRCFEKEAEIFKALGHATRLWIVSKLADGKEHCVCEFVDAIGDDFSTISNHLTVLKSAGVVTCERRGKQVWYSLSCPCVAEMLSCVREKE